MTPRTLRQSTDGKAAGGWSRLHHAVVDRLPEIGDSAFAVYAVLLRLSDKAWFSFPSKAALRKRTGMRPQRVRRAICRLQELGLVKVIPRRTSKGDSKSNGYIVFPGGVVSNGTPPPVKPDPTVLSNGTPGVMSDGTPYQEPSYKEPSTKRRTRRSAVCSHVDGFAEWYGVYPKKVAKNAADKAYTAAVKRVAVERSCSASEAAGYLLERARAFAQSDKGRGDAQYIPYPTTWLNQGRYDDEAAAWQIAPSGGRSNGAHQDSAGQGGGPIKISKTF